MDEQAASFASAWERLYDLCSILRGNDGCDWDRAQTSRTLAPFLLEEIHELLDAHREGSRDRLVEEAGDVVYLLTFFLQLVEKERRASIAEIARAAEEKLLRRHPHVFGQAGAEAAASPRGAWERTKREEAGADAELLRRLPASLPALARAWRLQERAAAFSFDWAEAGQVLAKIREEVDELSGALEDGAGGEAVREELGDLLFAVVNLSRHLGQEPEAALASATEKFRDRFNRMAASVESEGGRMGEAALDVLEEHWRRVKEREPARAPPGDRRR